MAFTLNRRLAQLVDSNGQLNTGKIPNDYITSDHVADNTITAAMLHTSFTVSTSNLTAIDTDDVSEGSSNLYFTNARADARIAAATTDDLTEGSTNLYYTTARWDTKMAAADTDDLSEGSTNLYFTNARIDSHLSGGTGVTYSSGEISIGQDVGTSATPTFGNITTTGYIAGPATFTIDPAAVGDNTGTVVIAGNLQVDGTTTTINSTTVNVDDLNIQLATGAANAAAADGAGITVDGASATITYDGTNDEWDFNKDINVSGSITTGQVISINNSQVAVIQQAHGIASGNTVANTFQVGRWKGVTFDKWMLVPVDDGTAQYSNEFGYNFSTGAWFFDNLVNFSGNISVAGNATINGTTPLLYLTESDTTDLNSRIRNSAGNLQIHTANDAQDSFTARVNISHSTGDISFYEDTGTTAKLFWDASAESLGIGETSPLGKLHVKSADSGASVDGTADELVIEGSGDSGLSILSGASNNGTILFSDSGDSAAGGLRYEQGNNTLNFRTNGAWNRLYIDSSGNVGIGTSPSHRLHVNSGTDTTVAQFASALGGAGNVAIVKITASGNSSNGLRFIQCGSSSIVDGGANAATVENTENAPLIFGTNNTEAMRIDASGDVGIGGISNPLKPLHLQRTAPTSVGTPDADTMILLDHDGDQYIEFRTTGTNTGIMQGNLFTDNGVTAFIGYKQYAGAGVGDYGESIHIGLRDFSSSDQYTGIYLGNTTADVAEGISSPHMFIKSGSGNVGIGTVSNFSTAKLQVKTATNVNLGFQTGTTETTGFKINAYNDAGNANIPLELNGSVVVLKTGEARRMTIDASGNVNVNGNTTTRRLTLNSAGSETTFIPNGSGLDRVDLMVRSYTSGEKHGQVIACDNNGEAHLYMVDTANGSGSASIGASSGGWGLDIYYDGLADPYNLRTGFNGTWTKREEITFTGERKFMNSNLQHNDAGKSVQWTWFTTPSHFYAATTTTTATNFNVNGGWTDANGNSLPSNVKAIYVTYYYHIGGYSTGSVGQGDHATDLWGPTAPSNSPISWSFTSSGNAQWGSAVFMHDGDASENGDMLYYGAWYPGAIIAVNSNNNIYGLLGHGHSGGTHYHHMYCWGYAT